MDFMQYIDRGGFIIYILIILNILGFTLIFYKVITLLYAKIKYKVIVNNIVNEINIKDEEYTLKIVDNLLVKEMKKLEFGINTISIIANISPLLGLLGTVIGVLQSFDSISKLGLGDPSVFSAGISIALITTVAGMIVAIPHFIAYNYFVGVLDKLENKIESQVLKQL